MDLIQPIGFEGQISDTSIRVIRGAIEKWSTGSNPVPFGRAVVMLPNGKISLPTAAGQKVIGISVATDMYGALVGANPDAYPPNSPINVLTLGDMFVWVEAAVERDTPLFFRSAVAAAPNDRVGRFGIAASAGLEVLPGLKTLKTTNAAGITLVSFNSP